MLSIDSLRRLSVLWVVAALTAQLGPATVVFAQEGEAEEPAPEERQEETPQDSLDTEAQNLFNAGQSAYGNGRYENALEYFQRAYELSERAELLYNIAMCADRLHRTALAIESFESYLAHMVDATNRENVEARIHALRTISGDEEPQPATPPDEGPGVLPWMLTIGGGVVLIAGAALLGYALAERAALEDIAEGSIWSQESGRHDAVTALSATGIIAIALGAAALTTGIVMLLTGGDESEPDVEPVVGLGYVGLRGRL